MKYAFRKSFILLVFMTSACVESSTEQTAEEEATSDAANSVWTMDLVRTLPGQQAEYLRNIENNWAGAREIAINRKAVLSFRALAAPPDSVRGWDVVLLTEYADSAAWADREEIFESIFGSAEYVRVPTALPSSELREFAAGGVVLEEVVSSSSR